MPGKLSADSKHQMVEMATEMSLRQFGSVTDLLSKLRADLRVSFPRYAFELFLFCNRRYSLTFASPQLRARVCCWALGRSQPFTRSSAGDPIEPSGNRHRHHDIEYDDIATHISDLPEKGLARRIGVPVSNYLQIFIMHYHIYLHQEQLIVINHFQSMHQPMLCPQP